MSLRFLRKIKIRIALSFSLLFLIVAIPAIIYALHEVNMFFEGMYLEQMKAAGLTVAATFDNIPPDSYDSLATEISNITSATVFLISSDGHILAKHYGHGLKDTSEMLSLPLASMDTVSAESNVTHKFVNVGWLRYLQVRADLPDGKKLLQVKSFSTVSMLMVRMREVIIWGSFLTLIALIAVAFYVAANITRPIEELTELVYKIRAGQIPPKTEIKSPDEVGDLAFALNDILDELDSNRKRIDELEHIRRDFFANVSDDLKIPLVNIQNMLQELQGPSAIDETMRNDILEGAVFELRRLERIIHSLIEISKIEFGEEIMQLRPVKLSGLIFDMQRAYENDTRGKNLHFETEIPAPLNDTEVQCDESLIKAALGNLLSNAIDFTIEGDIKIICQDQGRAIKITVEDSGPGIRQDQITHIFERLYKGTPSGRHDLDRAGLGLAIALHIIEAHGQKLDVHSELGIGSKFSFLLKKSER